MKRKAITPEIMEKVWRLHTNTVGDALISETLGISIASASRIIKLMTMAQNGEDVDSVDGNNHQNQKAFAKKYFGVAEKPTEEKAEESTANDDLKEFAVRVLFALEHQNKLLEKLCAVWGCEEK